jgi:hypothetical protein
MIATLLRLLFNVIFQLGMLALRVGVLLGAILVRLLIFVVSAIRRRLAHTMPRRPTPISPSPSAPKSKASQAPEFTPRPLHPPRRSR